MPVNIVDPRQSKALFNYRNPTSETFGNLYQSLVKAGYDEDYASSIYVRDPKWLMEGIKNDVKRVKRAEANLDKYLNVEISLDKKLDVDIAKLQVDVSKFVLKSLAKQKYNEDGEKGPPAQVQVNIINYNKAKEGHIIEE